MNDAPWGICTYCKEDGPVRLTYFDFPIKCECCGPTHHERIQHCSKCEAVMPKETIVHISTKKLFDPISEGLFIKIL